MFYVGRMNGTFFAQVILPDRPSVETFVGAAAPRWSLRVTTTALNSRHAIGEPGVQYNSHSE